eukprot:7484253-Prorocentrum_lima.AAC.1
MGLQAGFSADISVGWSAIRQRCVGSDQARLYRRAVRADQVRRALLLVGSSPCTTFSLLYNLSRQRRDPS